MTRACTHKRTDSVRFRGQSGHYADVLQCLLMTRMRHGRVGLAVMHNTPCGVVGCGGPSGRPNEAA
jgi:hypothetical protein